MNSWLIKKTICRFIDDENNHLHLNCIFCLKSMFGKIYIKSNRGFCLVDLQHECWSAEMICQLIKSIKRKIIRNYLGPSATDWRCQTVLRDRQTSVFTRLGDNYKKIQNNANLLFSPNLGLLIKMHFGFVSINNSWFLFLCRLQNLCPPQYAVGIWVF